MIAGKHRPFPDFILWVVKGNHTNPCSSHMEPKRGGVAKYVAAPGA